MRKIRNFVIITAVLSILVHFLNPISAFSSENNNISDGTYTLPVALWNASLDEPSMGNNALMQTGKLVAKDGKYELYLKFSSMTFSGMTGYLSSLELLEDITFNSFHYPESYKLIEGNIISSYNVVDSFNGPDSTDINCSGKMYPKVISLPVSMEEENIWAHVYVPVMGSLGFGNQLCRIHLDRSRIAPITEEEAALWKEYESGDEEEETTASDTVNQVDKTKLQEQLEKAKKLLEQTDKYTEASLINLKGVVADAQKAYESGTSQTVINGQVEMLKEAIEELVEKSNEKLDKDNLSDGKYYVYIYLWKATANQASMGDPALNHQALLTVKDGSYQVDLSTKTMTVGTITACLQSLQIKQSDGSYVYADITARNNPDNQPSIFQFTLPSKEEYIDVLIDPKVEVMGKEPLPARLRINWDTLKRAKDDAVVKEKINNTKTSPGNSDTESTKPTPKVYVNNGTENSQNVNGIPAVYSNGNSSDVNGEKITKEGITVVDNTKSNDTDADILNDIPNSAEQTDEAEKIQQILAVVMVGASVFVSGILAAVTIVVIVGRRNKS